MARRSAGLLVLAAGCHKLFDLAPVPNEPVPNLDALPVPDAQISVQNCSPTSMIAEEFEAGVTWFPAVGGSTRKTRASRSVASW